MSRRRYITSYIINLSSGMKLPVVILPISPQNPVMEETVWEQYTVTLQRVSPSALETHARPRLIYSVSFFRQAAIPGASTGGKGI